MWQQSAPTTFLATSEALGFISPNIILLVLIFESQPGTTIFPVALEPPIAMSFVWSLLFNNIIGSTFPLNNLARLGPFSPYGENM